MMHTQCLRIKTTHRFQVVHSILVKHLIVYYNVCILYILKCVPINVCEHAPEEREREKKIWIWKWKYETIRSVRRDECTRMMLENHFTKELATPSQVTWDSCICDTRLIRFCFVIEYDCCHADVAIAIKPPTPCSCTNPFEPYFHLWRMWKTSRHD